VLNSFSPLPNASKAAPQTTERLRLARSHCSITPRWRADGLDRKLDSKTRNRVGQGTLDDDATERPAHERTLNRQPAPLQLEDANRGRAIRDEDTERPALADHVRRCKLDDGRHLIRHKIQRDRPPCHDIVRRRDQFGANHASAARCRDSDLQRHASNAVETYGEGIDYGTAL
jgi:hypothetical protein